MIKIDKFGIYDPDSSEWAWNNLYNQTYRNLDYWKKLSKEMKQGKYKRASFLYNDSDEIQIGGDVIFNFSDGYGRSFRNLLGNQFNEEEYNKMHYSVLNFSFMPVTGGLNLNKANGGYCDRVDRLIFYVDKYIQSKKIEGNPIMNIRGNNRITIHKLSKYLSTFDTIEEFCNVYYLLDMKSRDLIHEIIDSGEEFVNNNEIPSAENCKRYLKIARDFWKYRNKILGEKYELDSVRLDDGVDIKFMKF